MIQPRNKCIFSKETKKQASSKCSWMNHSLTAYLEHSYFLLSPFSFFLVASISLSLSYWEEGLILTNQTKLARVILPFLAAKYQTRLLTTTFIYILLICIFKDHSQYITGGQITMNKWNKHIFFFCKYGKIWSGSPMAAANGIILLSCQQRCCENEAAKQSLLN